MRSTILVTLVGTLFFAGSILSDSAIAAEKRQPYEMLVVIDDAYGRAVREGQYDEAIAKLVAGKPRAADQFTRQTNLCVAYAKTGNLELAESACDAALQHAQRGRTQNSTSPHYLSGRTINNIVVALSNRGVVHAVQGDAGSARADFEQAASLRSTVSAPARNLLRLTGGASDEN